MAATDCKPMDTHEDESSAQPTAPTTVIPASALPNSASTSAPFTVIPFSKLFSVFQSSNTTTDATVVPLKIPLSGNNLETLPPDTNDCNSSVASPAKPAEGLPAVLQLSGQEASVSSTTPSASAAQPSDPKTNVVQILSSSWPVSISDFEVACPSSLTHEGVTVTLKNSTLWNKFYKCGTEMIVSRPGRQMFPNCSYRLSGLDPDRQYSMVLSVVPTLPHRYRCVASKWDVNGPADNLKQSVSRAIVHRNSPCSGRRWMQSKLEFHKLKLTNDHQNTNGYIIIHSMHRYIPRLHIIPVPDGVDVTPSQPVAMGSQSITFTFPQMEFMAVTCYQNIEVIQLKIDHNPLARSFKKGSRKVVDIVDEEDEVDDDDDDDETTSTNSKEDSVVKKDEKKVKPFEAASKKCEDGSSAQSLSEDRKQTVGLDNMDGPSLKCTKESIHREEPQNTKKSLSTASPPNTPAPLLKNKFSNVVLRPISFSPQLKRQRYTPCIRGGLALGELFVVEDDEANLDEAPNKKRNFIWGHTSPESSPGYRKSKKKTYNRAKCNTWTTSHTAQHDAVQPQVDDVEGQLFVSFTSKEHLDSHTKVDGTKSSTLESSLAPITSTPSDTPKEEEALETQEESLARLEDSLKMDLGALKHRQVIHPQLQEVGLKLSSLEPTVCVDLQYLGVALPPPPQTPTEALPSEHFVSRTGKTSDVTKIKGWKNKFAQSKESTLQSNGSEKNLSAFCSDMLDKYLEKEALQISERAAAFSTCPEGSVAYQLPAQSSSYVKTLDSALRHRNAATLASKSPMATQDEPLDLSMPKHGEIGSLSHSTVTKTKKMRSDFAHLLGAKNRPQFLSKFHTKLQQMEMKAISKGPERTQMTADRVSSALSAIVTKKAWSRKIDEEPQKANDKVDEPVCGRAFCRLGCVCVSLKVCNKGPNHCQRPGSILDRNCFKIPQQPAEKGAEQSPVHSIANTDHDYQARRVLHMNRLWAKTVFDDDPEPLHIPAAPLSVSTAPRNMIEKVVEEEKDPVYKYLESMMTCARVRPFDCLPVQPTELGHNGLHPVESKSKMKSEIKEDQVQTVDKTSLLTVNLSGDSRSNEMQASKQIEIESACNWKKDQKMILEGIFRQIERKSLSEKFCVGPYCINPITRIFMKKPSGCFLTYRIRISHKHEVLVRMGDHRVEENVDIKSTEDEGDDSLKHIMAANKFGVVPFMMGVTPAGILTANKVPSGGHTTGRIQVNGKCYNHTKLLLGNMGALHPANRLAAYITGRVARTRLAKTNSSTTDTTKPATPVTAQNKTVAASTVQAAPSTASAAVASLTTNPKNAAVESGQGSGAKIPAALLQFVPQQKDTRPIPPKSLVTTPVSLTVSSSLKQPRFSTFRIYPPRSNGAQGQTQLGLRLPGGFTLCKLPKPGAPESEASCQSTASIPENVQKTSRVVSEAQKAPLSIPDSATSPQYDSDESRKSTVCSNKEPGRGKLTLDQGVSSEDDGADTSDSEVDFVDIMTVQEELGKCVEKLKEKIKCERNHKGMSVEPLTCQNPREERTGPSRRSNHIEMERQRRSEQRELFNKLQTVLQSNLRSSRLHLLEVTLKEIKHLQETAKRLEQTKKMLLIQQNEYLKQLEVYTGTSKKVIKDKLSDVCEKQKLREKNLKWRPLFSHLLQTNAALLQVITPQSKVATTPLLVPDTPLGPFQSSKDQTETQSGSQTTTKKETVGPVAQKSPEVTEDNDSDDDSDLSANENCLEQTTEEPDVKDEAEPMPLLITMDPEEARAHWNSLTSTEQQAKDQNSQTNLQMEQLPVSLNDDKSVFGVKEEPGESNAKSDKDSTQVPAPQEGPARVNEVSLSFPLVRTKDGGLILPSYLKPAQETEVDEDGSCSSAATNNPKPSSVPRLTLSERSVLLSGCSRKQVENQQNNSPGTGQRKRGRPRKEAATQEQRVFRPSSCINRSSVHGEAKRPRGRPLKSKSGKSDVNFDSVFRLPKTQLVSQNPPSSRPQTRASLGKDFPSEKRRSWIDLERDLESEVDAEGLK
ncbi:MAX gene-associated protein isoform X2 [Synchiropus splendidus]|uniref:MAX gene-associated protein isoform X2 n=1 Tax=Synchiropus splendidus TaxID=270530 RepID=UPI00237E652B|nr:MAX gene-associated protein isoform X2 [Synchiropus splendidus]